jgi:RNAse (barnase) inhibitor barstar
MSAKAATITTGRSGVYRAPTPVDALRRAAGSAAFAWIELPLRTVTNKKQFLAVCATQLKLPSYFGYNWDALADCVRDFSWWPSKGYVLHIADHETFAKASADDYQTALDVLKEAAEFWKSRGTPFVVLVEGAKGLPAF